MAQRFYQREFAVTDDGSIVYGPVSNVELTPMSIVPGVPGRPVPKPPIEPPTEPPGPVDPGYGIPELPPGWSKAAVGPPPEGATPPADIPLAANYDWGLVRWSDKTTSWAQLGPHITLSK